MPPMETIRIAEATENDIPHIRNIAMAAWPVTYSPILSVGQIEYMLGTLYSPAELLKQIKGDVHFFIAYHQQQAVAFCGFGPQGDDYKLHKLYVRPEVQKTGAGKRLLQEIEIHSKKAGAQRLILNVHRSNPAHHFYEKQGFRIYEIIDIPFGAGFVLKDFLMEKAL